MLPRTIQHASQIDHAYAIQLEGLDGRTTYRCDADDQRVIVTPYKMIFPPLLARMVERYGFPADRVLPRNLVVFMVVAALTR